jgi:hypothetical protein
VALQAAAQPSSTCAADGAAEEQADGAAADHSALLLAHNTCALLLPAAAPATRLLGGEGGSSGQPQQLQEAAARQLEELQSQQLLHPLPSPGQAQQSGGTPSVAQLLGAELTCPEAAHAYTLTQHVTQLPGLGGHAHVNTGAGDGREMLLARWARAQAALCCCSGGADAIRLHTMTPATDDSLVSHGGQDKREEAA